MSVSRPCLLAAAVLAALLPPPASAAVEVRMIGVQLAVDTSIYASTRAYADRLDRAVSEALKSAGPKAGATIVVLPEHTGTFLAFTGEDPQLLNAPSRASVVTKAFLRNPGLLRYHLASVMRTRTLNSFRTYYAFASLLRYKAKEMWETYTRTASEIASRHRVILVAGSIAAPRPEEMDLPVPPLYGASAVFGPGGGLLGVVRKLHPVLEETMFLSPAPAEELVPIDTPAGKLGVLICSDSWYQDAYDRLRDADYLAVPSLGEGGLEVFDRGIKSFDGENFESGDADGSPTVQETLLENGLAGRISSTKARGAVQPFLTGRLWDMETGGPGLSLRRNGRKFDMKVVPSVKGIDTYVVYPHGKRSRR